MKANKLPSLETLNRLLSYDPTTGLFTRSDNGKVVGRGRRGAYTRLQVKGFSLAANRVAWYMYHGTLPREGYVIDHLNGVLNDNRIENLRELNQAQNSRSRKGIARRFHLSDGRVI